MELIVMGGSIRCGMEALLAGPEGHHLDAVVIGVCDQPFCRASVFRGLVACYQEHHCAAVQSAYGEVSGVPVLFSRSRFAELLELKGPEGARRVLQRHAGETVAVPFAAGAIDIDTPEDHARLISTRHQWPERHDGDSAFFSALNPFG